ncbi:competence protein [Levilactobacillus acidifarinae DSM 19394]|uniref:Competence protein n=1 Tax=Levilactobacillus acidifarinae DSM 19394 = JCM 15949 TaxID=1423715 RepID=A0A0R1LG51_9LACO|nr:competence protein [Levilactobacillus acidifarinae DSM 19394]
MSTRTAGYQKIGCYPFWLLGHRYAQQRLNWALIERFMGWLPRWELCLPFWDVTQQRLQLTHHLYQDVAGHYGGQVTSVANLAALIAGPTQLDPYPRLSLKRVRYHWAQELARATPNLRAVQEFLYLRGHHLLGFPEAFETTGSTPPVLGRGLLLWRILFGTALFALNGPLTSNRLAPLAQHCLELVGGHEQTVRVSFPHLVDRLQAQLMTELVQRGYLTVVPDGWQIRRQPRWRSARIGTD